MKTIDRRDFFALSASLSTAAFAGAAVAQETTQIDANGFFTLGRRENHWFLMTPEGQPFFSIGLNHLDPASMRYPENVHLWRERYGGNTIRWIEESVVPNLTEWGFNTVGWVQEVTVRQWRHSRAFTLQEYQALKMPYCHLLPFTESHQWEKHTVHYDFRSEDWREWCDYVARSHCAELREERNLIGYFYSDCPTWTHERPANAWRGPIFDPERLESDAGRRELFELATAYYSTIRESIRRYDPHHLVLGDRYEANAPIADEVIAAAKPHVDVLSFQDFRQPVEHMQQWHTKTGKPVLLADGAGVDWQSDSFFRANNGAWYADTIAGLFENPGCIGFHFCGAYQRNKARRRGLLDELERPDSEQLALISTANQKIAQHMTGR